MTERDPISTPALPGGLPFDASQIQFTPAGAGAMAETVQTTLRRVVYADQYMIGDGVTNDTAGWLTFKALCLAAGIPGVLSAKTYLIDAFSFANHSGLKLRGNSNNPNVVQFGGAPQTVLKLRTASGTFITMNSVGNMDIQDIHFDGNQFADTVVDFPGTLLVTQCNFQRCSFDGATPTTGLTFNIHGTLEADYCLFSHCLIGQTIGGNGTVRAASLIANTNSNAFNISFEHCRFQDAIDMFVFGAGSCSFFRCGYFNALTTFFKITSVTQPFSILDPYTEQSPGVPFFKQTGSVGITNGHTITIGLGGSLNSTNDILLNCQQPVRLMGFLTGGNIDVTPLATFGTQYVYADNLGFAAGKGWTGTGYPSQVISINENKNLIPQPTLFGPSFTRIQAAMLVATRVAVPYSASITIDAASGNEFDITATNNTAFTINAPVSSIAGLDGQRITFTIRNASGGVMGAITWNAVFKMLAFTVPTNGNSCSIDFRYDGTNWVQVSPQSLQIPN